jgi:hypothetical protein
LLEAGDPHGEVHMAFVSSRPTETVNNLIKRVKRVTLGFRRFAHCRIRALLYAGRPNGNYSPPSLRAEIRRALMVNGAGERLLLAGSEVSHP